MSVPPYIPDRRPLGARDWNVSRLAAQWLAARRVAPNLISLSGLVASLGAGAALAASGVSEQPAPLLVGACGLIVLRGLCNMFDGMVAVATGKASPGGELYNEVPDRISDSATLVGAGYAIGGIAELGYLAALAAMFTAYVRVTGCALGTPADFRGPMSKIPRMIVIIAAALHTALAPAAWQPAIPLIPGAGSMALALAIVVVGCALTAMRRLHRSAQLLAPPAPPR